MNEGLEICEAMKNKLNRNLNQDEISFLKWLSTKQSQESNKTKQNRLSNENDLWSLIEQDKAYLYCVR